MVPTGYLDAEEIKKDIVRQIVGYVCARFARESRLQITGCALAFLPGLTETGIILVGLLINSSRINRHSLTSVVRLTNLDYCPHRGTDEVVQDEVVTKWRNKQIARIVRCRHMPFWSLLPVLPNATRQTPKSEPQGIIYPKHPIYILFRTHQRTRFVDLDCVQSENPAISDHSPLETKDERPK